MIWHKCVLIYDATFYDRVVREEINKIKSKSTEIISITMKINIIYIYISNRKGCGFYSWYHRLILSGKPLKTMKHSNFFCSSMGF